MGIKHAQRHRQALPPVDDADQIGILRVVIGQAVAVIAETVAEDALQGAGHFGRRRRPGIAQRGDQIVQMPAIFGQRHPRPVHRRQQQRRARKIDRPVVQPAGGIERRLDLVGQGGHGFETRHAGILLG